MNVEAYRPKTGVACDAFRVLWHKGGHRRNFGAAHGLEVAVYWAATTTPLPAINIVFTVTDTLPLVTRPKILQNKRALARGRFHVYALKCCHKTNTSIARDRRKKTDLAA